MADRSLNPRPSIFWDQLIGSNPEISSFLDVETSQAVFVKLQEIAEEHGRAIYEELVQEHQRRVSREREKADHAFHARRRSVERIGLPQVRNYRLHLLTQEEKAFQEKLVQGTRIMPGMTPLLIIRVHGGS